MSENFRERFRLCVVEAGRYLPDYPKGTDPEDFWLHQLYLDLLKNNSDLLFCGSKEGGMILSVCVASATFCARLERQALQQSEPGSRTVLDRLREIDPNQPVRMTERREHNARTYLVEHGIAPTPEAIASLVQNNGKATQKAESKPSEAAHAAARKAVVTALLAKKNFSVHDWANAAGVDWHTADNYLNGKTKPYQSTIGKLAGALGVEVEDLPE